MAAVAALICFVFACFEFEPFDKVKMLPLGLMFLALAFLVGNWPFGFFARSRQ